MANSEDKQAAKMLRQVENRIVWLTAFLVEVRGQSTEAAASSADAALDAYQKRFEAITPPD